jgi:hypothetical protein
MGAPRAVLEEEAAGRERESGHGGGMHGDSGEEDPLIRLKHIYNFLCSMLVYTPFALCFVTLRGVFMHFPELTY